MTFSSKLGAMRATARIASGAIRLLSVVPMALFVVAAPAANTGEIEREQAES
jgi:hypothetical protein